MKEDCCKRCSNRIRNALAPVSVRLNTGGGVPQEQRAHQIKQKAKGAVKDVNCFVPSCSGLHLGSLAPLFCSTSSNVSQRSQEAGQTCWREACIPKAKG